MNTLFILLIGTFLIIFNVKMINKDKQSFKDTFDETKENLPDYKLEIGQLRKEFAETVLELQSEIEKLKFEISNKGNEASVNEDKEEKLDFESKDVLGIEIEENHKTIDHVIDDEVALDSDGLEYEDEEVDEFTVKDVKKDELLDDNSNDSTNDQKIQEVRDMIEAGKSIDEIAKTLNIGKGEVQLIKGFYLR
ncbi:hypothetical protein [Clostridium cellulovorans]|uniref:Uncharacterized protein n=1 Tax=Clostridium cellulovorans (strain ATCC 35296 / DSM 3052 / OCM 3 / 743B) TaxID=573061 RepID=D9SKI4_CLOC7|nr:hypothetical protein [Clostridium cellulovorans]ADL51480.1 hypothetical protein Clocel_1736 [Clostridium cellulovorans 743B]